MDKSRNNEVINREVKCGLKAIENNDNILEKTKSQYIKRSMYSTKYNDYQIDKVDKSYTKKKIIDRKYASLNFNNFTLIKSQSTANFPEQKNVLPVIKIHNMKNKQTLKSTQYTRPVFHDLFISSKLNDNSISRAKNTAFKFSIDIDNLLTKKLKPKLLTKIRTSVDISKEGIKQDPLYYYDQELPEKYKTILSNLIFNINFIKKQQKTKISQKVKQSFFEELLNIITRKISIYNQNNQFIRDEEVVGFINHEVHSYFKKNRIQLKKRHNLEYHDIDINQKEESKKCNSLVSNYNYDEINYHKQFIKNKLIKKELNRSDDLFYHHDMIIKPKMNLRNPNKISHVHLMLNCDNDDSTLYNNVFLTTSPQYSSSNKHSKREELRDREIILKRSDKKHYTDDLDLTMRSFYALHPKGLNDNSNSNDKKETKDSKLLAKNNNIAAESNRTNKSSKDKRSGITTSKRNNNLETIKTVNSSHKTSSLNKTQNENCFGNNSNYYHESLKASLELKKQMELEEIDNQRLRLEKGIQKKQEAERLEKERLAMQKERIKRQEEEYQCYVEMKRQEEQVQKLENQEEELKQKNAEKMHKKNRKFCNFYIVNKENQESLLSVLQPSKSINKEPLPKNLDFNIKSRTDKKDASTQKGEKEKEDISPSNKGSEKTERKKNLSSEKFQIQKLPIQIEDEELDSKRKREIYQLKIKQDLNYFLSNNKKLSETNKQQMEEFKEKINQSLVNFNNQIDSNDLISKLEKIQEQIEDFKEGREEEKRINSFIHNLNNKLMLMKQKNHSFYSKYKIVNNQLSSNCLMPITPKRTLNNYDTKNYNNPSYISEK